MSDARWGKRFEQRLEVFYGIDHCNDKGYAFDISPFGLFISGDRLYPPDSMLKIKFKLDKGSPVELMGKVCRAKKQQRPSWFERDAGMGIKIHRFIDGELYYQDYLQRLCAKR
jgi:hypothetical protein